MKHNRILSATLLGGLMILSAACVEEASINEQYRPAGSEIAFSASAGYNNGTATRTEYSGYVNGSNDYERINWLADDPLTINYTHAGATESGNYVVTSSITPDQEISNAEIEAAGEKLHWGEGTGDHLFYAMYPTTGFKNNSSASLVNNHVRGTIPAAQTVTLKNGVYEPAMQYGYMIAYKRIEASSTASVVKLPFRPAMTAIQFRLSTQDAAPLTVSSFEMSSTSTAKIAGTFEFDITGGNDRGATWNTVSTSGTTNKITVTFAGGTPKIEKDKVLDFTVFALPVDFTEVTIKLNFTDGSSKRLELKKNATTWFNFEATKKYRITNAEVPGGEVWDYFIEEIPDLTTYGHLATTSSMPFNVVSYKVKRGTTTKVPVAWNLEYQPSGASGWSSTPDDKIDVNITSGGGSAVTTANGANISRDHNASEYSGDAPDVVDGSTAALRTAADIPAAAKDSDGYYDLSKHPVYGPDQFGAPQSMETANCYIVQGPGLYKFPLVYGNAIKAGATNKASYDVSDNAAAGQSYFLSNFLRHDDQPITNPWIKNNGFNVNSAIIVWQDGTDNADGQIIKDADVTVDGDYIKFEVKRELIRPGNVIIAARVGSTVVWSWHIWVTEKDLTPKAVKDAINNTNWMMNYNLGWMDATAARGTKWNDWTTRVRITQAESGKQVTFRVRQIGETISVDANIGSNTFYQWGRKDPMLPAASSNTDKAQYSASGMLWEKSSTHTVGNSTAPKFGHSIQHPNWQYVALNLNEGYWTGYFYLGNLWDSGLVNDGNVGEFGNRFPVKTVYDPCPRGFVVPYLYGFSGFGGGLDYTAPMGSGTINGTQLADGYRFNTGISGTIFFPFCGARAHDGNHGGAGTSIYDVRDLGYYWTACANRYNSTTNASGVETRKTSKMMIMLREANYIRPGHEQRKAAAYAIRPVLEDQH